MNFLQEKNLKLRELETIDNRINELLADSNGSMNTDSISGLFYDRDRKLEDLKLIYEAEKAMFTRLNPRDGQIVGEPDRQAENVHDDEINVI